ncbi:MAG: hypothetical protein Q4G36_07335 [Paracoccus sp. (in: a-proteobacteria)]|nr:hypothetical protein [Paracoccus sp. (in: a-proteobacteria)]
MRAIAFATALAASLAPAYGGDDPLSRVLAMIEVDLEPEVIGAERALLVRADGQDGDVDFYLYAGVPDDREGELLLHVPAIAWAGPMAGQSPEFDLAENGSLILREMQIGIGRNPWDSALTIANRGGKIIVAGYSLNVWDRVSASSSVCDWNLLTGRWSRVWEHPSASGNQAHGGEDTGRDMQHVPLRDWPARPERLTAKCDPQFPDD